MERTPERINFSRAASLMARLPKVGGDDGNWGQILNDYLSRSLTSDGSLQAGSVGPTQLRDASVTESALADSAVSEMKLDPSLRGRINAGVADGSITTSKLADRAVTPEKISGLGAADGVAMLDNNVRLPESQLPQRLGEAELRSTIDTRVASALSAWSPGGSGDVPLYPALPLVARGTSLTAQTSNPIAGSRTYALLAADLGITVINRGDSGADSAQIEHLAGAVPGSAIVAAGSIPASGYAVLTAVTPDVTADGDISSYVASIAGVRGTIARVGTERRFTPSTHPSAPVIVSNPVAITSLDNEVYRDCVLALDCGTNDIGAIVAGNRTLSSVTSAIARVMATQRTLVKRRMVWGVLDRGAPEGASTATGIVIRQIEAFLEDSYPDEYLPLRSLLSSEGLMRAGITPTSQDNLDIAAGAVPQSLRDASSVHLNAAGMAVQADIFADWFRDKNWFPVLSPGFDDTFTRADSSTTLGTDWTALRGIWGVQSNDAYVATLSPAGIGQIAVRESLAANGAFEVTFGTVAAGDVGGAGLVFRAVDANNHLLLNSTGAGLRLFKRVAGSATVIADASGGGVLATGDVIRVELSGNNVSVKKNGTTVINTTVIDFATATKHGIAGNGSALNATRFARARFIV